MADAETTADEDCPECYVQGVCLSLLASTIQSMGYCCWKVREQCRAPACSCDRWQERRHFLASHSKAAGRGSVASSILLSPKLPRACCHSRVQDTPGFSDDVSMQSTENCRKHRCITKRKKHACRIRVGRCSRRRCSTWVRRHIGTWTPQQWLYMKVLARHAHACNAMWDRKRRVLDTDCKAKMTGRELRRSPVLGQRWAWPTGGWAVASTHGPSARQPHCVAPGGGWRG